MPVEGVVAALLRVLCISDTRGLGDPVKTCHQLSFLDLPVCAGGSYPQVPAGRKKVERR